MKIVIPQPKRSWFPLAFLLALVLSGLIVIAPVLFEFDNFRDFSRSVLILTIVGTILFPIGMFAVFFLNMEPPEYIGDIDLGTLLWVACWCIYLALITGGMFCRSKGLFIVLLTLLLMNIAGCHYISGDFIEGWGD